MRLDDRAGLAHVHTSDADFVSQASMDVSTSRLPRHGLVKPGQHRAVGAGAKLKISSLKPPCDCASAQIGAYIRITVLFYEAGASSTSRGSAALEIGAVQCAAEPRVAPWRPRCARWR